METKKKVSVLGGGPGQNKAEVTVEERDAYGEGAQHAKTLVERAGKMFTPEGAKYLGSATIHYYSKEQIASNPSYFHLCQVHIGPVVEQHADLGWKELKSVMMKTYGRNDPKEVKR